MRLRARVRVRVRVGVGVRVRASGGTHAGSVMPARQEKPATTSACKAER